MEEKLVITSQTRGNIVLKIVDFLLRNKKLDFEFNGSAEELLEEIQFNRDRFEQVFNAFQDESKKAITSGRRSGESVRDYLTREWRNRRLLYSTYRRKLPKQPGGYRQWDNSRIPYTPKRGRYENIDKNELAEEWISSQSFLTEWV